ncbi:MAG: MBL fold metallo-hydrolase [Acidobacteria bacterium]|nr:MBL fold metallo-hydrolase [Acidobacteriota bacterium]
MRKQFLITLVSIVLGSGLLSAQARETLDIYVVDVEGGNATLFVTPTGGSVLIDSGNGGANAARDAGRIVEAVRDAGLTQIDHYVQTHWHGDHFGGLATLESQVPIRAYYDAGPSVQGQEATVAFLADVYPGLIAKASRTIVDPGDTISIDGLEWTIITAGGDAIQSNLRGGGSPNPYCASWQAQGPDTGENAQSVGSHIRFGEFTAVHPGDITWNVEGALMCPENHIGTVDVLFSGHHGQGPPSPVGSNTPQLVNGLAPRVSIINNGTRKGGQPESMRVILNSPGLEDVWMMHFSLLSGQEYTVPGMFIANTVDQQLDLMPVAPLSGPNETWPDAPVHNGPAHWIKVSANRDGSFSVTNPRNNFTKMYQADN